MTSGAGSATPRVIELTYQIGVENMRARMYLCLGITEQGFGSGDASRPPWATEADGLERRSSELVRVVSFPDGDLSVADGHGGHPRR